MANDEIMRSVNYTYTAPEILPSTVKRLFEDLTAQIELKLARVSSGLLPADDFEEDIHELLQLVRASKPERTEGIRHTLARPLTVYRQDRRYKVFSSVDLTKPLAVDQINVGELHRTSIAPIVARWVHIPPIVDGYLGAQALQNHIVPQAAWSYLKFRINKVKCYDETTGWGSDESYVSANGVDETGDTSYYWFRVSNDFDEGELVDYGFPGKQVQVFGLKEGGGKFPKIYTCSVAMVEHDWASVSDTFKKLNDKINAIVKTVLIAAGVAVGSIFGLGELGAMIGEFIAWVHAWWTNLLFGAFGNDYMGAFTTKSVINSYSGNWLSTGTAFRDGWIRYQAHGGDYKLWFTWELAT